MAMEELARSVNAFVAIRLLLTLFPTIAQCVEARAHALLCASIERVITRAARVLFVVESPFAAGHGNAGHRSRRGAGAGLSDPRGAVLRLRELGVGRNAASFDRAGVFTTLLCR